MRITHTMLTDRLLGNLRTQQDRISQAHEQVSTGRRINRPSDDPAGARAAVTQRADLAGLARQKAAVAEAADWTDATDTALGGIADLLHRARELAVQGANGNYTTSDREKIAAEIDQLAAAAKERANARVGDRFIFSGTATTTAPYATGATDTYAGDAGAVLREIGPGVTVQVNQLGSQILGSGQTPGDGLLLDTLRDLSQHLRGGTPADLDALRGADLQALQSNLDTISTARSANGATAARLDSAASSIADLEFAGVSRLDRIEGADMAQAILSLSTRQSAYEAALKSGATVIQPSLMDFLR